MAVGKLTKIVGEELSNEDKEPKPLGYARTDLARHVRRRFDVFFERQLTHAQIEAVDVQAVGALEAVAVEAVVVDGEEHEVDDEPQEADECEQIGRQPERIELDAPVPERRHDVARQG